MINHKASFSVVFLSVSMVLHQSVYADSPDTTNESAAQAAFTDGNYHKAIINYQNLLKADPNNQSHRIKLAESYVLIGDLTLAEDHALQVLESSPRYTEALLIMGRIRGRQHDWAGARTFYERAIKSDNSNSTAYLGFGQALMQLGDTQAADGAFANYRKFCGITLP